VRPGKISEPTPGPAARPKKIEKYGWDERESEAGEKFFFSLATIKEFGYILVIEFSFLLL
jgi:hypothetical protein